MDRIRTTYIKLCNTRSDIHEHLPTLYKYATECESVVECGVRGCVSSWALTYGLLNNNKPTKSILLNDLTSCNIQGLLDATKGLPITVNYEWKNDLDLVLPNVDMVFIDTWHVYGHLKRELAKFSKVTMKYIAMHDTTVDGVYGETIRMGLNAKQQSKETGYPIEEINCGLWKAVEEFLANNPEWKLKERFTNNNGLTILERL